MKIYNIIEEADITTRYKREDMIYIWQAVEERVLEDIQKATSLKTMKEISESFSFSWVLDMATTWGFSSVVEGQLKYYSDKIKD